MAGINFNKWRLAGETQHQQRLLITQHIGKQLRFIVDQIDHIFITQQRTDLFDAGQQRTIVANTYLFFQRAIQGKTHCDDDHKRQQRKNNRQPRGQRGAMP